MTVPQEAGALPPAVRRSAALILLVGVGVVVGLVSWRFFSPPYFAASGDASDYAAMGRNLARGEGFRTSVVYPLQLALFPQQDPAHAPNLHRPPLLPLGYAVLFAFLGAHSWVVAAGSAMFVIAAALMIGFGPFVDPSGRMPAALALLLYPPTVMLAATGLSEPATAFVCLVLSATLMAKLAPVQRAAVCGALTGLATLLKYPLVVLLPFVVFACRGESGARWKGPALAVGAWLLVVSPWLVRNAMLTGNPAFTLQSRFEITKDLPGYEWFRVARSHTSVKAADFAAHHPGALLAKSLAAWREVFCGEYGVFAWPLYLGLIAWWLSQGGPNRAPLGFWLAANLALLLCLGLINLEPRYLYATQMPLWVMSVQWAAQLGTRRIRLVAALLAGALILFVNGDLIRHRQRPPDFAGDVPAVAAAVPRDALILTDVDSFVAWHVDRTAIWFPSDEETLSWMLRDYRVDAVYLQGGLASEALGHFSDRAQVVQMLARQFPHDHALPGGGLLRTR